MTTEAEQLSWEDVPLTAAAERAEDLVRRAEDLRTAGERLKKRKVDDIVAVLDEVVRMWLRAGSPWLRAAQILLPRATGFSAEMVRYMLPSLFTPLRSLELRALLDGELGSRHILDGAVGGRHARGPALAVHILPGNIPGLGVSAAVLSLAIKTPLLIKVPRAEPVLAELFVRSIGEFDAELGSCVATGYWRGGDRSVEDRLFSLSDLVVMAGSDANVEDVRARCPARFIAHGQRVSFAFVSREIVADERALRAAADALALDVSAWDQRGCLSPQVCLVETDAPGARRFGELIASALSRAAADLPPRSPTLEEAAAVRRFRDEARWSYVGGKETVLFASPGSIDWTVVVEPVPEFRPTPLCRSVRVLPVESVALLRTVLAPVRRYLECAGVAASEQRYDEIVAVLLGTGVHRICPLGRMQYPSLRWTQSGRLRVAEWVTWVEIERKSW